MNKLVLLAFLACGFSNALTNEEATNCLKNIDAKAICISKTGCYSDFSKNCVGNSDHDGNKACKLVKEWDDSFDDKTILSKKENGQTVYLSPDEFQKIVDQRFPLSNDEVIQSYNTWLETYKTAYNAWNADKNNFEKKQAIKKAFDDFYTEKGIYLIKRRANYRADVQIAQLECQSNCAVRLTNVNAKNLLSSKIKCYGDRPAGKSIDGSTSHLEQGAKNNQIKGAVVDTTTESTVSGMNLCYGIMISILIIALLL